MTEIPTSITGRADDKQVLLLNEAKSEAIVMGIKDLDNAAFVVISYLKAIEDPYPGHRIDIVTYQQYSVDGQAGYIIKYKRS